MSVHRRFFDGVCQGVCARGGGTEKTGIDNFRIILSGSALTDGVNILCSVQAVSRSSGYAQRDCIILSIIIKPQREIPSVALC